MPNWELEKQPPRLPTTTTTHPAMAFLQLALSYIFKAIMKMSEK